MVPRLSVSVSQSVQSLSHVRLWPHESQHTRPPCPSPTPGVHSNSCPLSRWCHPAISSSVIPFSSCPQSLQASGSFLMSQLFTWGGQSIGVSASASVLPMNTQDWSLLGWTGWISLQSKGLSRVFSNTIVQKHQFFGAQLSSQSNSHIHTWPAIRVPSLKSLSLCSPKFKAKPKVLSQVCRLSDVWAWEKLYNRVCFLTRVCCGSVAKSCLTLCEPMNCYLLEFAQTHVHWVGDAIQLSHPLLPPSPALDLYGLYSAFLMVQLSHLYMTTGITIA